VPELNNNLPLQYILSYIFQLETYLSELLRAIVMKMMMMMMMITTRILITPTKQQTVTVMAMVITVTLIIVTIKMCKYLQIEEIHEIEYKNEKGKPKTEYLKRLRSVLGTELSPNNKTQGIALLAETVLMYIDGNIK
jgi:hypothetical protein